MYHLGTWFVSGICVWIPCIKETMMMMVMVMMMMMMMMMMIDIQCMWNVKAKVIPVITRTTGTISKSFGQYLSNITGKHKIKELQKQPYWALQTYCGSCYRKIVHIAQLEHYIH